MKIQKHVLSPNGRCIFCGAAQERGGGFGERTCIARDDGLDPKALRPEPALRLSVVDDTETISKRIGELYQERTEAMNHADDL